MVHLFAIVILRSIKTLITSYLNKNNRGAGEIFMIILLVSIHFCKLLDKYSVLFSHKINLNNINKNYLNDYCRAK